MNILLKKYFNQMVKIYIYHIGSPMGWDMIFIQRFVCFQGSGMENTQQVG